MFGIKEYWRKCKIAKHARTHPMTNCVFPFHNNNNNSLVEATQTWKSYQEYILMVISFLILWFSCPTDRPTDKHCIEFHWYYNVFVIIIFYHNRKMKRNQFAVPNIHKMLLFNDVCVNVLVHLELNSSYVVDWLVDMLLLIFPLNASMRQNVFTISYNHKLYCQFQYTNYVSIIKCETI